MKLMRIADAKKELGIVVFFDSDGHLEWMRRYLPLGLQWCGVQRI